MIDSVGEIEGNCFWPFTKPIPSGAIAFDCGSSWIRLASELRATGAEENRGIEE